MTEGKGTKDEKQNEVKKERKTEGDGKIQGK
jgi:hypothetical protein